MSARVTVATPYNDARAQARTARREVEDALDAGGWRWLPRLSRWLDALIVVEESR